MRGYIPGLTAAIFLLSGCSAGNDTKLAEQEVARFHTSFDAGQYAEIYAGAGPQVHRDMDRAEFVAFLTDMKNRLGKVAKTESSGWKANYGTSGKFITLNYKTAFTNGGGEETFVYTMNGSKPTLTGYYIKTK